MLTSDIIPLDPADPVPRKERRGLPWRWIVTWGYVAGALACLAAAIAQRML